MALSKKQKERIEQEEWLILQVELHIEELMEKKGVSRAQLARKLGKDRAQVTQFFEGKNKTLKTIADVLFALDSSLVIDTRLLGFHTTIKRKEKLEKKKKWMPTNKERENEKIYETTKFPKQPEAA